MKRGSPARRKRSSYSASVATPLFHRGWRTLRPTPPPVRPRPRRRAGVRSRLARARARRPASRRCARRAAARGAPAGAPCSQKSKRRAGHQVGADARLLDLLEHRVLGRAARVLVDQLHERLVGTPADAVAVEDLADLLERAGDRPRLEDRPEHLARREAVALLGEVDVHHLLEQLEARRGARWPRRGSSTGAGSARRSSPAARPWSGSRGRTRRRGSCPSFWRSRRQSWASAILPRLPTIAKATSESATLHELALAGAAPVALGGQQPGGRQRAGDRVPGGQQVVERAPTGCAGPSPTGSPSPGSRCSRPPSCRRGCP